MIQQVIRRLPHTCGLPESFSTLSEQEQKAFLEDYYLVAQQDYLLRERVGQGDPQAWQEYQQGLNAGFFFYLQQHCIRALPYYQEIQNRLWQHITPESVPFLFGDALEDLIVATIQLCSLWLVAHPA